MDEEAVFKALADGHRRKLLDLLFHEDGQSLSQLEAHLPMTRFGVMKHLSVLEDAGLLTTRKVGREKHHYLNPIPIQQVYDRWVSKYAQPITHQLAALKQSLEKPDMTNKPKHVFQIYIQTTPEKLWQALTDADLTQQYYFTTRVESTWETGAEYAYHHPDGYVMVSGEVIESVPPTRLVTTFRPTWRKDAEGDTVSQVTYEIEQIGPACKLTLTHIDLDPDKPLTQGMMDGWAQILSGLKTLLETGEPMYVGD